MLYVLYLHGVHNYVIAITEYIDQNWVAFVRFNIVYTHFFYNNTSLSPSLNMLNFSEFENRIILNLFLYTNDVTLPEDLRNALQFLLMFYYIINLKQEFIFCIII